MSDPLGLVGRSGGGGPVQPAPGSRLPSGGVAPDLAGPNFKDVLLENIEQVNKLQQDAAAAQEDLLDGKRNDLEAVLMATQKADTAFKALLQVRNKVMEAYEEIKQIRV